MTDTEKLELIKLLEKWQDEEAEKGMEMDADLVLNISEMLLSLKGIKVNEDDIERQKEELFIKFEFQREHEHLSYQERIDVLNELIPRLPEEKQKPYIDLIKFLENMIDWEERGTLKEILP